MPKNLLLADDSVTIQKMVAITFANEDYAVSVVDNGEDAVAKARAARPDVILLDAVMPRKNGYEACEALKADPALAGVPVILLAGTFEAFDEARARTVRADAFIQKPFESQALINKVRGAGRGEGPGRRARCDAAGLRRLRPGRSRSSPRSPGGGGRSPAHRPAAGRPSAACGAAAPAARLDPAARRGPPASRRRPATGCATAPGRDAARPAPGRLRASCRRRVHARRLEPFRPRAARPPPGAMPPPGARPPPGAFPPPAIRPPPAAPLPPAARPFASVPASVPVTAAVAAPVTAAPRPFSPPVAPTPVASPPRPAPAPVHPPARLDPFGFDVTTPRPVAPAPPPAAEDDWSDVEVAPAAPRPPLVAAPPPRSPAAVPAPVPAAALVPQPTPPAPTPAPTPAPALAPRARGRADVGADGGQRLRAHRPARRGAGSRRCWRRCTSSSRRPRPPATSRRPPWCRAAPGWSSAG